MGSTKRKERIMGAFRSFKGILPYIGVAAVLLILTFAIYAIYTYISNGLAAETMEYNWEYAYSDSPDSPLDENNTRLFGAQTAIVRDRDVVRDYVSFRKTFDATEEPFNLVILTDHSPIRVLVNDVVIYNNHYGTERYVGNCYNAVRIGGTGKTQYVRVDIGLPFSVRFEPHSVEQHDLAYRIIPSVYMSAAFFILGVLSVLAAVVFSIIKKRTSILFTAALYVTLAGAVSAAYVIPEITYMLNAPVFFRLFNTLKYLGLYSVAVLIALSTTKRSLPVLSVTGAGIVSVGMLLLIDSPGFFAYAYIISGLLMSLAVGISAVQIFERVKSRIQLAPTRFVISLYLILCTLFTIFFDASRITLGAYLPVMAVLVTASTLIYIRFSGQQVDNTTKDLLQLSERHSHSVATMASILHDMMDAANENQFLTGTAEKMYYMLCQIDTRNAECKYSVAVKDGSEYKELENSGISECDYRGITRHCELRKLSYVYSGSYFAFTFNKEEAVHAIIYFENIADVLDEFFISILLALYSGLDLIYQSIIGQSMRAAETSIFVQLAKNVDIATGTPGEHIERVSKYVYAVCRAMDLDDITSKSYALASKLHDIGKLAIPHSITAKPGRFTDSERFIMKGHTDYGAIILSSYQGKPIFKIAAAIALYHHEQFDGKGYHGLSGESIPLCAKITAVCDAFDALTTKRDYKDKWTFDSAVSYISENSGSIYDPKVVDAFMNTLAVIKRINQSKEGNL